MIAPDDGVSLPIAEPRSLRHHLRALVNEHAVGNLPAPRVTAVAFPPLFLAAQVPVERAAFGFVGIDVLINALVADARLPFERRRPEICSGLHSWRSKFSMCVHCAEVMRGLTRCCLRAVANSSACLGR
jgi:hypothetical protein